MNQPKPFMIDIVEPAKSEAEGVADLLIGSIGLAGAIAVSALVIGAIVGGLLFWLRSRRGPDPLRGPDGL